MPQIGNIGKLLRKRLDLGVVVVVVVVVSHIQRIGCQPEKTTLHGGQSRSWSAEQGKENKRKSLAAYPPPPPPPTKFTRCVFRGLRLNRNYSYLYIARIMLAKNVGIQQISQNSQKKWGLWVGYHRLVGTKLWPSCSMPDGLGKRTGLVHQMFYLVRRGSL